MEQPEIILLNDYQILMRIDNGAIVSAQKEDPLLAITYRAIVVNGKVAYMRSHKTGKTLLDNPVLMAIVQAVMAMCV